MRQGATIIALLLAASVSGSACAMSGEMSSGPACRVEGGDKLPPAIGGAEAICDAIREALAGQNGAGIEVRVQVDSPYSLTASIEKAGTLLPEQKLSIMDSKLTRGSVKGFARRIAEVVSEAGEGHR